MKLSSLGGDLDHALNIHDQIAEHKNVTVEFTGFNASSSTIIALKANKTKISKNSYYLIHKVMSWIDEFGYVNEDDLESLIAKLEKDKNENAKITLNVAQMYSDKSGKSTQEILSLMKEETWLTADEALEWGFVDEVFEPANKTNLFDDKQLVARIAAIGLPNPDRKLNSIYTMTENKNTNAEPKGFAAWMKQGYDFFKSNESIDPKDQEIADLKKEAATLKENTVDPRDKEITDLKAEVEGLKANEVETTEETTTVEKPKTEVEKLNAQVDALKKSAVQVNEVEKTTDTETNDSEDNFFSAVARAKELQSLVNDNE